MQRSTVVAKMHPANKSTPLNAKFLACQVASMVIFRCAVANDSGLRDAIPTVSKQRFTRSKDGKPHPQNAPSQRKPPLDAKVLACQVISVKEFRCAVAQGHALQSPTVCASRNNDARDPEAETSPRNAPATKHPIPTSLLGRPATAAGRVALQAPDSRPSHQQSCRGHDRCNFRSLRRQTDGHS